MNVNLPGKAKRSRQGVGPAAVLLLLGALTATVALAADVGQIVLVRTQLQAAADSAAVAAAAEMDLPGEKMLAVARRSLAGHHRGGGPVDPEAAEVEYGVWDAGRRAFTARASPGNAVRVTARAQRGDDGSRLFFGKLLKQFSFVQRASAVALANPRDVVFLVDLSGSMNDDTEPCWATDLLNGKHASLGGPAVGDEMMQNLYEDFGFGAYPGVLEHVGAPSGVPQGRRAYAELTRDGGPLTGDQVPAEYRIRPRDDEPTRQRKAYSAIIDFQLRRIMPAARPIPDSSANYAYWAKYLDYVIEPIEVTAPDRRGRLPPQQDDDCLRRFNNPNLSTFGHLDGSVVERFRNRVGYLTYVQFMVDHGRDLNPVRDRYVPLSQHSPDCPWHVEQTPAGAFRFPPRTQPMHSVRRALIAGLQMLKQRNSKIPDVNQRDWVSIIAFDSLTGGGPVVEHPLSADYHAAMLACCRLQAVGDKGATTATESAMILAREHLGTGARGPGRRAADKVLVLLTDGAPNVYTSPPELIDRFVGDHASGEFYGNGAYWYDAPLMQAMQMRAESWYTFPVGVGLGADQDFLDRLARLAGTAHGDGQTAHQSGGPAEYERRLAETFRLIIANPPVRLVQ